MDDDEYNKMSQLADEFFGGIANKLQRYLILKSWWATNYVTDWWEQYVYLRGRSPIMVNSNYYGVVSDLASVLLVLKRFGLLIMLLANQVPAVLNICLCVGKCLHGNHEKD